MSMGREVADAYIEVHGDLKDFRRSLSKAAAAGRKEGMELADSFSAGFEKRATADFGKKWDSVLDATFSNKKVDWDRLVGTFDATGFDDAAAKIDDFLTKATKGGKITELQYKRMHAAVRSTTSLMEAQHKETLKEQEIQRKLREKQLSDEQARRWEMAQSRAEQERYNDSFAGMFRANQLKSLEADFRRVSDAMADMDWSKFTKGEENLDKVTKRVREVIGEMNNLGRVTDTQGKRIIDSVSKHVAAEEDRRQALLDSKAATDEAKAAQDRYNKSLAGMMDAAKLKELESDFRRISDAMSSMDWSKFTKGEENLNLVSTRIREVVKQMQDAGRVSKEQGEKIAASVRKHVIEEERRRAALRLTAEETLKAKEAQDKYNKSLAGMMDAAKLKELENGYKKIAAALANQDWGPVSKDFSNMRTFTTHVRETAEELRKTGKIGEDEFRRINDGVDTARRNTSEWNVQFGKSTRGLGLMDKATSAMQKSWARMDGTVKLVLTGILGAAGPMATVLSGAAAGGAALASSLGMALASAIPLAAATVALGVGIGLAVKSMDSMKAAFPLIQQSIDRMSAAWTKQAEAFGAAWGASLGNLLESFATQLESYDFGGPLGEAFAVITDALNDIVNGPAFAAFMGAMTTDLPDAVAGLGTGFVNLFGGLLSMMAAAAPAAKALGEDFAAWGEKIAASLEKARETGKLNEVFQKARESLLAVLDLAGSVGSALGTMFMLGADTGNRMLTSLSDIVDKFNAWMQTEAGRAAMMEWFENGERILRALQPLAVGLAKALGKLVTPNSIKQVEDLMTTLGDLLPIVGGLLAAVSDLGILNTFASLLGLVMKFVEPLLPAFNELTETMGTGIAGALEAISPLFTALGEALAPVVQMFADNLGHILPHIPPMLESIVAGLVPLIETFGLLTGFLGPLISGLVGFIASFIPFEALGLLVKGALDMITGALQILIGIFTLDFPLVMQGAQGIMDGFILVVNSLWMAITNAFTGVTEVFNGFVAFLAEVFAPVGEFIATVWAGIVEGATAFGVTIGTFFTDTWTTISTGVTEAWQGMLDNINEYLTMIGEGIKVQLDLFWAKFDEVFPGIRELVGEEMEEMKENLTKIFNLVKENLTEELDKLQFYFALKWQEMKNNATAIWDSISAYFEIKWLIIRSIFTDAVDGVKMWLAVKWYEMKNGITAIWDSISAYFEIKWLIIRSIFTTAVDGVKMWLAVKWYEIKSGVTAIWDSISSYFEIKWMIIRGIFDGALTNIGTSVNTGINRVLEFFVTLPNDIMNYLLNLPSQMEGMGTNMMQGMVIGITKMATNILDSALKAVKGAIDGVKNFLGIKSPSRLFMGIGGFMGEGMAIGIDKSAKQVAGAAHAMAEATTAEFSSSKMYVAGQDAAAGLARGLKDNKSAVTAAFSALQSEVKEIGTDFSVTAGRPRSDAAEPRGKTIIIEDGAVRLETKTTDPQMSADMLLDGLVNHRSIL